MKPTAMRHRSTSIIALLMGVVLLLPIVSAQTRPEDLTTPIAAARYLYTSIQAADAAGIERVLYVREDSQRPLAAMIARLLAAGRRMQVAARQRFGESAESVAADMTLTGELKWLDESAVRQEGDRAELTPPGTVRPMIFIRQTDQWKLDIVDYAGASPEQLPRQVRLLGRVAEVLEKVTLAISDGKLDSPSAVQREIDARLDEVMTEAAAP